MTLMQDVLNNAAKLLRKHGEQKTAENLEAIANEEPTEKTPVEAFIDGILAIGHALEMENTTQEKAIKEYGKSENVLTQEKFDIVFAFVEGLRQRYYNDPS
jgi:hypothetical protein